MNLIPQGGGQWIARLDKNPGPRKLSVMRAAKEAGISPDTIRRLFHAGFIKGKRSGKRKILIYAKSLAAHLKRSRKPGFWERHKARMGRKPNT